MSEGYRCELCIYKSLSSIAEPLEVIVILDMAEHSLGFNWTPASMHQSLVTCQKFSGHRSQFIVPEGATASVTLPGETEAMFLHNY